MESLPVTYTSQKNAWMDRQLFSEWFHQQFVPSVRRYARDNQQTPARALLLIDNCPAHPVEEELRIQDGNIWCIFLPKNCTSKIQPCDAGIIEFTKRCYRKRLLSTLANCEDKDLSIVDWMRGFTLRDAVNLLDSAWAELKQSTIAKCWQNSLFTSCNTSADPDLSVTSSDAVQSPTEIDVGSVAAAVDPAYSNAVLDDWLHCDEEVPIAAMLTDEEIVQTVCEDEGAAKAASDDEDDDAGVPVNPPPTASQAFRHADGLLAWLESLPSADPLHLTVVRYLRDQAGSHRTRQTDIRTFLR